MVTIEPQGDLKRLVTIDGNTINDNGSLACQRGRWPGHLSHNSIAEGISNLLTASNAAGADKFTAAIVGHGNYGCFGMGCGDVFGDASNEVNEGWSTWQAAFASLKHSKIMMLTVYACSTGGHSDGRALVQEMAEVTGCEIRAPSGLVTCGADGIHIAGPMVVGVGQRASGGAHGGQAHPPSHQWPGGVPPPRGGIRLFDAPQVFDRYAKELFLAGGGRVPITAVTGATITSGNNSKALTAEVVQQIVGGILSDQPLEITGAPLALKLGKIEVRFSQSGTERTEQYELYENGLAWQPSTDFLYMNQHSSATLKRVLNE